MSPSSANESITPVFSGRESSLYGCYHLAAQFYLKQSIRNPGAWKNQVAGKLRRSVLFNTPIAATADRFKGKNKNQASIEDGPRAMLEPFARRGTTMLSVKSDRHAGFYQIHERAYRQIQSAYHKPLVFPQTCHLLTSHVYRQELIDRVCEWASSLDAVDADSSRQLAADMTG